MAFNLEAREAAWNSRTADIFSGTIPTGNTVDDNFSCCTNELLGAHKLLTRLWWNVKSLEEYLKLSIVPRGLRVQIFPAWEVETEFKQLWEAGLTQCSKILINLLVEHDRKLIVQTKLKIQGLEADLSKFDHNTQVEPFLKKLKESLDKYKKEILEGKKKKQIRDKNDYEKQAAFKWQHSGNRRGKNTKKRYAPDNAGTARENTRDFLGATSSDTEESRDEEEENPVKKQWPKGRSSPPWMRSGRRQK